MIWGSTNFYHQGAPGIWGETHEFWKSKGGSRRIFGSLRGEQKNFTENFKSQNINLYYKNVTLYKGHAPGDYLLLIHARMISLFFSYFLSLCRYQLDRLPYPPQAPRVFAPKCAQPQGFCTIENAGGLGL